MKNHFSKFVLSLVALFIIGSVNAQAPFKYLTYIFPSDSLQGFDEKQANQEAMQYGYFGSEYHVFMYSAKRNFINLKYGYSPNPGMNSKNIGGNGGGNGSGNKGPGNNTINSAPCINEDFESSPVGIVSSTLAGWSIAEGQNNYISPGGSCTMNGCCPTFPTNNAWVVATPVAGDPVIGTVPNSPLGGSKVLKMNDNITNKGEVVRIQQTFPVTANNAVFQFAFMGALNGTGHACCSQPYIRITLIDCSANLISCPQVSITPPGPSCATVSATGWTTNSSGYSYTPAWMIRSIDLSPYIGTCITVQITVGDCDGWAHFGYAYVDCKCLPMTVCVNNVCFPAGSPVASVAACGVTTATMVAPPGLGPYSWTGPPGSGITANPNQTITTTMAGQYTLTMNPIGVCTPITKTVTLTFGTNPTAGFTATNSCTTYSFTNTGTGPPAIQTFSFVGPSAPPSFTSSAATNVVNFAPSTTYTVYQVVTNTSLCTATASMVITTPPGPNPAFTATPSFTQCMNGNSFTFNATTAAGSHTYNFNPTVGSPASSTSNPYGPVSFTAPGTYTVTHTINNAGCTTAASSLIVVNQNPTVTATFSPAACAGQAGQLTGGGLGSFYWTGPNSFTSIATSPTIIPNSSTIGIYTLTSTYFGCTGSTTVQVTMPGAQPQVTVSNSGPVCLGQPLSFSATWPSSMTPSYYYWYMSNPYYYGGYNVASPTIAVTTTANAGTYTLYIAFGSCPTIQYTTNVQIVGAGTTTVSNTGPYCVGQQIQLNVTPSTSTATPTFTWAGPGSFSSNTQNPNFGPATSTMAGVYTVTTSLGGCKVTKSTTVVVNPLPNPVMGSNSPVCQGNNINLTTTGGGTYSWSGPNSFTSVVQNPVIVGATTAMAGVYTVTVTSTQGCKNTGTVSVSVTTPTTTASNTGPYCAGANIQLNTPIAGGTYTWSGPAYSSNVQNPVIGGSTPAMSGIYNVTVSVAGCKSMASTSVTVNANPVPVPNNTGAYCPGNTIQLNVGAYNSYTWTGPSFNSNLQNPTIPSATTGNGGLYSVTVIDANGCVGTGNTNVIVNSTPIVSASTSSVCENGTLPLFANGGSTYSWSGPGGFTSALQNPTLPSASMSMNGVYSVTITSAQGCTNTAQTTATVNANPIPSAFTGGPVCVGATLNLNASGGSSYSWSGPGFSSGNQNPSIPSVTSANAGVYTVIVTAANTCTASATTNATINPLPNPNIVSNSPVCVGGQLTLTGSGGTNYSWSGPGGFTSTSSNPNIPSVALSNSGNYSLTVIDANGCVNSTNQNITINPLPNVSATGVTICQNFNGALSASGGVTYSWTGPNGFTSNLQNPMISNAQSFNSGVYTVLVTDANTCTNTAVANLIVNPAPNPQIQTNSPVCLNDAFNFSGTGGVSYSWSGPNGVFSSSQSFSVLASSLSYGGTYMLTVTDANGCSATTSVNTQVNAPPTGLIIAANNKGCSPVCAQFNIQATPGVTSAMWTLGDGSFVNGVMNTDHCYSAPGIYTVGATVTDAAGCTGTSTQTVEVYPIPVADFNHAPIKPIVNIDQEVTFTDASHSANIISWNWYFMNTAQYTSTLQNPTFAYTEPGTYAVALVVKSDHGCLDTIVRALVVGEDYGIYVPNAFTPNDDGLNDKFQPKGFGIVEYELNIFDRWGEKVFSTKKFEEGWDGKFQGRGGQILEEGTYTWLINVTNVFGKAHELKGHVTLIK